MDFNTFEESSRISSVNPMVQPKLQSPKGLKNQCKKAARVIYEADILVVVTGAGFFADSGLAVYQDVANVPAYLDMGLTYQDLCQPHWLHHTPSIFYGFWGQCFNDYRDTKPHDGYNIIAKWRDEKNARKKKNGSISHQIRKKIRKELRKEDEAVAILNGNDNSHKHERPRSSDAIAGAFFCYTSNVDAHWYDVCKAEEIHECHGNIEHWQCSTPYNCESGIWRAPFRHRFIIIQESMEAPPSSITSTIASSISTKVTSSSSESSSDSSSSGGSSSTSSKGSDEKKKDATDDEHDDDGDGNSDSDSIGDEDSIDRIFAKLDNRNKHNKRRQNNSNNSNNKRQKKIINEHCNTTNGDNKTSSNEVVPVIGHVLGKGNRANLLKHMPTTTRNNQYQWTTNSSTSTSSSTNGSSSCTDNWPKCSKCNQFARPAILMFDDAHWLPDHEQEQRYRLWQYVLLKICEKQQRTSSSSPPIKICILEIGCGMNVPTCRVESEQFTQSLAENGGAQPTLIRINPDFPLASFEEVRPHTIPIMSKGLVAINKIDYYYKKLKAKASQEKE